MLPGSKLEKPLLAGIDLPTIEVFCSLAFWRCAATLSRFVACFLGCPGFFGGCSIRPISSIELYTGLGTQPPTATFYSSKFSRIPLAYAKRWFLNSNH